MQRSPAASSALAQGLPTGRADSFLNNLKADRYLYLLVAPAVGVVVLFNYLPMIGVVMAFQDYSPVRGFLRSPWVGLENFVDFFSAPSAVRVIRNSVLLSLYQLLWSFPVPILFALILNEVLNRSYKKLVQTVSMLPYFLSNAIVIGMAVGHAMVCPTDRDLILYTSDINQRMWLAAVGRGELRPLHRHDKREWITHESFLGASDQVIFARWPFALMAIGVDDEEARVVAEMNAWHASANADGSLIVSDTTCPDIGLRLIDPATGAHRPLCYPRSSNGGTQWAFTVPADDDTVDESTYGPQWGHPHPSFHPDGTRVVYTSDHTGTSQVYVVEVPETGFSPRA